jgi:hypothetical protein
MEGQEREVENGADGSGTSHRRRRSEDSRRRAMDREDKEETKEKGEEVSPASSSRSEARSREGDRARGWTYSGEA